MMKMQLRLVGNEGNVIMVAYGKCKYGLTPNVWSALTSEAIKYMVSRVDQASHQELTFGKFVHSKLRSFTQVYEYNTLHINLFCSLTAMIAEVYSNRSRDRSLLYN